MENIIRCQTTTQYLVSQKKKKNTQHSFSQYIKRVQKVIYCHFDI